MNVEQHFKKYFNFDEKEELNDTDKLIIYWGEKLINDLNEKP